MAEEKKFKVHYFLNIELQEYRNTNKDTPKNMLQIYRNTNDRKFELQITEIQITEVQKFKLQEYRVQVKTFTYNSKVQTYFESS